MPVYKQRRGTAAALAAANETPAAGQIYFESDTNRLKIGDGLRAYNDLPYLNTVTDAANVVGLQTALNGKANVSHAHGNITNAGAIGGASGQIVVTGASGVLTTASSISAGLVTGLSTVATTGSYNDLTNKPAAYSLPAATASVLGGVRIGDGLTATSGTVSVTYGTTADTACEGNDARLSNARTPLSHAHGHITFDGKIGADAGNIIVTGPDGLLVTAAKIGASQVNGLAAVATSGSATDLTTGTLASARLPIASAGALGGIRLGSGLQADGSGVVSVVGGSGGTSYTLPAATASVLGGVKIGSGISVTADGVISASSAYTLPTASASVLGGIKIGSGLSIDGSGVVTAASSYTLPVATASVLGGVKAGANVTIDGTGVISVAAPVTSLAWTAITGKPTFATVATSGSYNDLSDKPAIPTAGTGASNYCAGNDARLAEEVVEYLTPAQFPATGSASILYVATDTGRVYRWASTAYAEVGVAPAPQIARSVESLGESAGRASIALAPTDQYDGILSCTLTNNVSFSMPSLATNAQFRLLLSQDATGGWASTFTNVNWPTGSAPTLPTSPSTFCVLVFVSDGTRWYGYVAAGADSSSSSIWSIS